MTRNSTPAAREVIVQGLIIAAVFLADTAVLKYLPPTYLDPVLARRLMGALPGVLVMFYANAAPKTLVPLARMYCSPAAEQAVRRFVGWALMLGGLEYLVVWLTAPLDRVNTLSMTVLGAAVLAAVARVVWGKAQRLRI
jgi:hypothetical protein